jgi:hypothetical protein
MEASQKFLHDEDLFLLRALLYRDSASLFQLPVFLALLKSLLDLFLNLDSSVVNHGIFLLERLIIGWQAKSKAQETAV